MDWVKLSLCHTQGPRSNFEMRGEGGGTAVNPTPHPNLFQKMSTSAKGIPANTKCKRSYGITIVYARVPSIDVYTKQVPKLK